jgi:tetratricopeptide (TPR) repeat protein
MRRTSFAVLGVLTALQWFATAALATDGDTCAKESGDVAIAACDRVIASRGGAWAYNNRGFEYAAKGDHDRAIRDYNEAIRLDPKYVFAYNNRGNAYEAKGDHDRAIRDYDETIRLDPTYVMAYSNRGAAYTAKGDHDRAIRDFEEALRRRPGFGPALANRGLWRERKGDREGARADFTAALAAPATYSNSKWVQETARARLAALGPAIVPSSSQRRVALVIGNGAYSGMPRLKNPANDATDVAAQLKTLGFEVTLGVDVARGPFEDMLIRFAREARQSEVALVFYAGHGLQHNGVNYLIPVDARFDDESDLRRLVQLQSVLDDLRAAKGIRILILDACRDNGIVQRMATVSPTRSAAFDRGLSRLDQANARGAFIVYATQPNVVAKDGDGRNSPFTSALLKHMSTPGLELRSVMTRVRADVVRDSRESQWPEVSDSLIGEFVMRATP